jgi:TusA-related sulfurtransferase
MTENSAHIIDAKGLSCPEPVLLAQNGLNLYGGAPFLVEVSSKAARDNVQAFLESRGRAAQAEEQGGVWRIAVSAAEKVRKSP